MATEKKSTSAKVERKKPAVAAAASAGTSSKIQVDKRNPLQKRSEMTGIVVSNKMQKTIVVKVDRRVRHELYKKYQTKSARFKAHDEKNTANVGDLVILVSSKPISREKRWVLQSVLRRAGQAPEANV